MRNKITSLMNDVSSPSTKNEILRKEKLLNLKNISFSHKKEHYEYYKDLRKETKMLFYFIIYFQFLSSTNAFFYRKSPIIDAQNINRDGSNNQLYEDETRKTPEQNILINCYLKIHLNVEKENGYIGFLVKNEAELKEAVTTYLRSSVKWKITMNDIESSDNLEKSIHFDQVINPYSFSLFTSNIPSSNKQLTDENHEYFISTTVNFETPQLYEKSKEKNIQRQRTVIVTFEEQQRVLYSHNNNDYFFNDTIDDECYFNEDLNFCENIYQQWRTTSIKSRRLVNIPLNKMNSKESSSSPIIVPVYLESYVNMENIVGIDKSSTLRILFHFFYFMRHSLSLKFWFAIALSVLVVYAIFKRFISLYFLNGRLRKENDNLEDLSNDQILNNIGVDQINEGLSDNLTVNDNERDHMNEDILNNQLMSAIKGDYSSNQGTLSSQAVVNNIEGNQFNESVMKTTKTITHFNGSTETTTTTATTTVFTMQKK